MGRLSSRASIGLSAALVVLALRERTLPRPLVALVFDLTADVDDGRIQLRNQETGVSQTSAPR